MLRGSRLSINYLMIRLKVPRIWHIDGIQQVSTKYVCTAMFLNKKLYDRNLFPRRRFSEINSVCWSCKKTTQYVQKLFCEHCGTLRKAGDVENHFAILNVDRKYSIDLINLAKNFKELQKLLHPDKYTSRSGKEQELSLEWSSRVNKAYSTLNNPLYRAEHLLESLGATISEATETKDTEFLMEMMERNEEIAEIATSGDASKVLKIIQKEILNYGIQLEKYVETNDIEKALKILGRMKYFYSLEQNLKNKASSLTGNLNN